MAPAISRVLIVLLAAGAAVALPSTQETGTCGEPKVRRAWHTLSDSEKRAYLDAELCLMSKPATHGLRGARTLFDEFQAAHVLQTEIAHFVGQFLPFHRLFLHAHEQALTTACGYNGAQPYWEESLDAGNFSTSPLLDPVLGFGGDGVGPSRCIQDGPFANYTNPLGPGYVIQDHCIDRQIDDRSSTTAAPQYVERCMNMTDFMDFWPCVESGPHAAGHGGIGAEMSNAISSPGDPIFFMHHAWLDRLWAKWQAQDPDVRFKAIGGNNRANFTASGAGGPPTGFEGPPGDHGGPGAAIPPGGFTPINMTRPADAPEPEIVGDSGNTTTLNQVIHLYGLVENRAISEIMDTRGVLCYEYD